MSVIAGDDQKLYCVLISLKCGDSELQFLRKPRAEHALCGIETSLKHPPDAEIVALLSAIQTIVLQTAPNVVKVGDC